MTMFRKWKNNFQDHFMLLRSATWNDMYWSDMSTPAMFWVYWWIATGFGMRFPCASFFLIRSSEASCIVDKIVTGFFVDFFFSPLHLRHSNGPFLRKKDCSGSNFAFFTAFGRPLRFWPYCSTGICLSEIQFRKKFWAGIIIVHIHMVSLAEQICRFK